MSRKQELYRMLIGDGFVFIRNRLSQTRSRSWWRFPPWELHKIAEESCKVAEFLHHVSLLTANEDFTMSDIRFLNHHAQSFFRQAEPKTSYLYTVFLSPTRQLIALVPDAMKDELKWHGPELPELTVNQRAELDASLFWAIEDNENIESLHNMLTLGANPNVRNSRGETPLDVARRLGKVKYEQVLRQSGARD